MNVAFETVLKRYTERLEAEERVSKTITPAQLIAQRDRFLLAVGEQTARLLHALVVARSATRILEVGTSYGYSTLFLADAARRTGGQVLTLELDAGKQKYARAQIADAGLSEHVEWHCGDATVLLNELAGPFDFVLIDLWKDLYVPCLEIIRPKLANNALVAADNMLEPKAFRPDAERYRAAVQNMPELQSVLLPVGSGVELSCVWRGSPG